MLKGIWTLVIFFLVLFFSTSCSFNKVQNKNIVRLGYMPNVTHATALIGIKKNFFQDVKPIHFLVGNSIIDAFITNQLDVAYIGPGPYINAIYRKVPITLLANAANGGTLLVGAIHDVQDGTRIAIPQYGNTQDLILRSYLDEHGLTNGNKKVKIFAIPPQDTATAFFTMSIDAACLPEPWGTILIEKGICKLILDEKSILNNGNYPVTVLIANKEFAKKNPEIIKQIIIAHKKANEYIINNPSSSASLITEAIKDISKKEINKDIIIKSMKRCTFTDKLDFKTLKMFTDIGVKAGYYKKGYSIQKI